MKHSEPATPARRPRRRSTLVLLGAAILIAGISAVGVLLTGRVADGRPDEHASRLRLEDIPFNGARAYEYLKQICALGSRSSGTPGMEAQQKLLVEHFRKLGVEPELQPVSYNHPLTGQPVPVANLLVHWHPDRQDRVLLCTHYDTLPFPLRDRQNPRGLFVGANDGGSGTALLMELGQAMPQYQGRLGVDFAFFDAEEFIFSEQGRYFVGSEHFARALVNNPPSYRYRWAVLLDMIGDAHLQIYQEVNSVRWPETRPLVEDIWRTAGRLGVREFVFQRKHEVQDDHVTLHQVAGIPACDLIDFDYPPWHTQGDTVEQCSALSLAKVGWVLSEWLKTQK